MDVEFHYYITYLLAARAGFVPAEALKIAYSCQAVDDNVLLCSISDNQGTRYKNQISQTIDVKKPVAELSSIYPIFHFVPWCGISTGEAVPPSPRKRGKWSKKTTAANNVIAQKMVRNAFGLPSDSDERLYRIGIALHAYADTWAHQNFIGEASKLNSIPTATDEIDLENLINIGHGVYGHQPDVPNLVWTDHRLSNVTVNNKQRFLDAAAHIFTFLIKDRDPQVSEEFLQNEIKHLQADIGQDIGPDTSTFKSFSTDKRLRNYRTRAFRQEYGGTELPEYNRQTISWAQEAMKESWTDLSSEIMEALCKHTNGFFQTAPIECRWRDPDYRKSDWYKFSESIKSHHAISSAILRENGIG